MVTLKWSEGFSWKPEVYAVARLLGVSRREAATLCMEVWEWVARHVPEGRVNDLPPHFLDELFGVEGLSTALIKVGWVGIDHGDVTFNSVPR